MVNKIVAVFLMFSISKVQAEYIKVCQGKSEKIHCEPGERIYIESITQTELASASCNYNSYQLTTCNPLEFVKTHNECHGKQQCRVDSQDLELGICKQYPRNIYVQYLCYYRRWFLGSYHAKMCSSTEHLHCGLFNWISQIEVKDYDYIIPCEHDKLNKIDTCLSSDLNSMCVERRTCDDSKQRSWCFYLPFVVDITYRCLEDSVFNISSGPSESNKTQVNSSFGTVFKGNETNRDTNVYNDSMNIKVLLGEENRLLGLDLNNNHTFSLCAYLWNDLAASVACRHLNLSSNGTGGSIPRSDRYRRYKIRVICSGKEASLFNCYYVTNQTIEDKCDSVGDATIQCVGHDLKDTTEPLVPIAYKLHKGYVVEIAICCILLVLIVTILVVRFRKHKKRSSNTNSREHRVTYDASQGHDNAYAYTEVEEEETQQISSDPSNSVPKKDANSYFILDPKETGYKRTVGAQQDFKNPNSSEDQYASSIEGVYDATNANRHVNKDDPNIYSHTVDDVYDISNVNRNVDKDDTNVYSHSVDDTYDVSGNKTKPDAVVDNEYQQFSSRENGYL